MVYGGHPLHTAASWRVRWKPPAVEVLRAGRYAGLIQDLIGSVELAGTTSCCRLCLILEMNHAGHDFRP